MMLEENKQKTWKTTLFVLLKYYCSSTWSLLSHGTRAKQCTSDTLY